MAPTKGKKDPVKKNMDKFHKPKLIKIKQNMTERKNLKTLIQIN